MTTGDPGTGGSAKKEEAGFLPLPFRPRVFQLRENRGDDGDLAEQPAREEQAAAQSASCREGEAGEHETPVAREWLAGSPGNLLSDEMLSENRRSRLVSSCSSSAVEQQRTACPSAWGRAHSIRLRVLGEVGGKETLRHSGCVYSAGRYSGQTRNVFERQMVTQPPDLISFLRTSGL